ncbi:MAG: hypothetical protein RL662_110 [Bacteroidota bacterium]|jgi:hypothetical protein
MDGALQMGRMVSVALSSVGAMGVLASQGTAILSTVGTALASIPVVGWIILAVIVVVVLLAVFWDDICAFFSAIWDWLTQMAAIVYEQITSVAIPWFIDTATEVWDGISTTIDDVGLRFDTQVKKLLAALAAATTLLPTERVYQVFMCTVGRTYLKMLWGKARDINLFSVTYPIDRDGNPTYKYGTTTMTARYTSGYIALEVVLGHMYIKDILFNLNYFQARLSEKSLIYAYYMVHGSFPPGNTKLG